MDVRHPDFLSGDHYPGKIHAHLQMQSAVPYYPVYPDRTDPGGLSGAEGLCAVLDRVFCAAGGGRGSIQKESGQVCPEPVREAMIRAEHISLCYRMTYDRVKSIKEYVVQLLKGKIQYEEFWALKDLSFEVRKGEVLGIVGHNGAGKSTLLKVISGILKPTRGSVEVNGVVAPMLELGSGFDFDLTGRENVFLNGAILGFSEQFLKERYEEIVKFSELGQFVDVPLRNYSSGMVARLAFSVATVVRPDILIVDEVLSVGDAGFQEKSKQRMLELMGGGTTVLFVSHSLEQIRAMCDRVLWIEHGEMKMLGDARSVCDAYEVN